MKPISIKVNYLILGAIILFFSQCSKAPDYPTAPQITYKSMTKKRMLQSLGNKYRDSLALTISFTDGDGDIGTSDNVKNKPQDAFIVDTQTGDTTDFFTLPYVNASAAAKGINGDMRFIVYTNCCDVPDVIKCLEKSDKYPLDTLFYKIIIRDRAGNWSNELMLPPIELICNQ